MDVQSEDYEKLWHLIIPPVMTLLDDYDAGYKLYGIQIVAEMLKTVPAELLRRTGVGELIFSVRAARCTAHSMMLKVLSSSHSSQL